MSYTSNYNFLVLNIDIDIADLQGSKNPKQSKFVITLSIFMIEQ